MKGKSRGVKVKTPKSTVKIKPKMHSADRRFAWKKAKLDARTKTNIAKARQSNIKTIAQELGSTVRSVFAQKTGQEIYAQSQMPKSNNSKDDNSLDLYNGIINGNPNTGDLGTKQEGSTTEINPGSSGSIGGG